MSKRTKPNTQKPAEKKAPAKAKTAPEVVKLAVIARELELNEKQVRGKFRRLYAADDTSHLPVLVKGGSRWTFAAKDKQAVIDLIQGGKDK